MWCEEVLSFGLQKLKTPSKQCHLNATRVSFEGQHLDVPKRNISKAVNV